MAKEYRKKVSLAKEEYPITKSLFSNRFCILKNTKAVRRNRKVKKKKSKP